MNKLLFYALLIVGFLISTSSMVIADGWNNSPYNFNNSPYNFNNSPYNHQNSPYNFDNSQYNTNSNNGVYDNNGNRLGYGVRKNDGGINYFDNKGRRLGYQPVR